MQMEPWTANVLAGVLLLLQAPDNGLEGPISIPSWDNVFAARKVLLSLWKVLDAYNATFV